MLLGVHELMKATFERSWRKSSSKGIKMKVGLASIQLGDPILLSNGRELVASIRVMPSHR